MIATDIDTKHIDNAARLAGSNRCAAMQFITAGRGSLARNHHVHMRCC